MHEVIIIDEMMGRGKSSAAINYINSSDERFIIITPYLDEVERYITSCPAKHFKEPLPKNGKKIIDVKDLIRNGNNIVCTHALFQKFDSEIINLCRALDYTMIMDEVAEVIQEYEITESDINLLLNSYCYTDDNGLMIWREDQQSYTGKFDEVKNLCNLGGLAIVRNRAFMWLFPVEVFKAFKKTYILTYMFNAQLQRYYYDYYKIEYSYQYVAGDSIDTYHFSKDKSSAINYNYKDLIHIVDNYKLNVIGDCKSDLSLSWYQTYINTALVKQLKSNIYNFFRNVRHDDSKDNIWTTFKDYKHVLSGKGYTKGFIPLNMRATNAYKDRTSLAYPVNRFLNPMIKGFFQDHGVIVDEDGFALSEMLQWIWRSGIRDGKEIWVYVPSSRMRLLLENWVEKISLKN